MARTGFFHHIGSLLLLAATALLIVSDVSAPVVNDLALLKIHLANATVTHKTALNLGTFGYCTVHTPSGDFCSKARIGYDPVAVVATIDDSALATAASSIEDEFSSAQTRAIRVLTRIAILTPIATGILFIAFLLGVGAGFIGSFCAALVALVGFLATIVVLITDAVLLGLVRNKVNDAARSTGTSVHAVFGTAFWTLVAAAACSLLGTLVLLLSCCSSRLHDRRAALPRKIEGPGIAAPRRRRFF